MTPTFRSLVVRDTSSPCTYWSSEAHILNPDGECRCGAAYALLDRDEARSLVAEIAGLKSANEVLMEGLHVPADEIQSNSVRVADKGTYGQMLDARRLRYKLAVYALPYSIPSGRAAEMVRKIIEEKETL